ncbi:MAG: RICIN domain-containing protein [Bacteroidaceae bacterium]|nr:RICIN domain-containing protein [Bacteroidaceae bacterium]
MNNNLNTLNYDRRKSLCLYQRLKKTLTCCAVVVAASCGVLMNSSCDRDLKLALELAGDNRSEMEKVLEHFKNDPDPLKYEAAKFLIENMPYHSTKFGPGVAQHDSLYMAMSEQAIDFRHDFYNNQIDSVVDFTHDQVVSDIKSMKADFLINVIDEACDLWHNVNQNDEYDKSLFFDYVLPYRLLDEPYSDWRAFLDKEFPLLKDSVVCSRRGPQIEAEDGEVSQAKTEESIGASQGKIVTLDHEGAKVSFVINSLEKARKNLFLRYTATAKKARVLVELNGKTLDTLRLDPLKNLKTFRDSRVGFEIPLDKGDNELSLSFAGDTIGVDHIQTVAIEPYRRCWLSDFSDSFCMISNKQTGNYITFDTLQASLSNVVELKPLAKNDSCQLLSMEYMGDPCWKISTFKEDSIDLCLDVQYASLQFGTAINQTAFRQSTSQKWIFIPVGDDCYKIMCKYNGLFLESAIDEETGKERLIQNPYNGSDAQKWHVEKKGKNPHMKTLFAPGSLLSRALPIFDVTIQYEFIAYRGDYTPSAVSVCAAKTGKCRDETNFVVYLCRHLGIPSAIDFTPHWGNRTQSHAWSVLIKPDGTSTPFYIGCAPGDTAQYYHSYLKPKVLRHRFQLNREIVNDFQYEKEIYGLFRLPDFIDVTDEYYTTTDVVRDVPEKYKDRHIAYICVSDGRSWAPVYYGNIKGGKVTFKSMGRNILYTAAVCERGKVVPIGDPFIVEADGTVRSVSVNTKKKQTMKLLRKYPFMGKQDYFNARMSGGKFQGANTADFSDATDFYVHEGITNGNWYDIPVKSEDTFRYLRYIGPKGSYCNINELYFYDENNKQIEGAIIGTEGESWADKDKVFDGDILTGFTATSPDGNWVGIQPKTATRVSHLRFIPRTDGNCIEVGDEYELVYWTGKDWKILNTQKAKHNVLTLKNMPSGGLYLLHDKTKGWEERIFTYEDGEQVWW